MCELPNCEAEATCIVLLRTDAGNLSPTPSCDACSEGLDESDDAIEILDLGAWAVARELDLDPVRVMEVHIELGRPPYAEVLSHLLRHPVK